MTSGWAATQVPYYIDQQKRRLAAAGQEHGIIGLVVPGERVPEASRLAEQTLADRQSDLSASDGDRTEDRHRVSVVVVWQRTGSSSALAPRRRTPSISFVRL